MKSHKYLYTIIILMIVTLSCQKDFPDVKNPKDYSARSYDDIFEAYWNGMNNNYVFWDIDPTDWDAIYRQYKPLFAKLDVNKPQDKNLAHTYFKEMTARLVDSHYGLFFKDTSLSTIRPSDDRRKKEPDYHDPIDANHFSITIPTYYLQEPLIGSVTSNENTMTVISGRIENNILYFYCSSFSLSYYYNQVKDNQVKPVLQDFFDRLKQNSQIKGVIIDVRGNGGGDLNDLNFLIGRMINKPLNFGYARSKRGNGRLDYGPWIPAFVTPQNGSRSITSPIVVLADLHSVSMAEITAMAVRELPNGYFVGERTWGGHGPLTSNEVLDGGQFSSPFLELVYTSSMMFKDPKGVIYEGVGLPPDIEVKYNQQAIDLGKDPQLERALELIRQGNK